MYSYVANWEISRDKWKEIEDQLGKSVGQRDKYLNDGTLVGSGIDINLVHQDGQSTHDVWWSSMTWAGLLKVLQANKTSGAADAPVFATGKHHDDIWASRYYNWRPGSFTNGYTRVASWKLKPDAPGDAIDQFAKNFYVPLLEKLLADGSIYEYEIDEQALHTQDPAVFIIVVIANGAEGLDRWNAAITESQKSSPFASSAFGSWIEAAAHRDSLDLTAATYK